MSADHISFELRRIGSGFCGTVWSSQELGKTSAFKREDGGPGRSLANDFEMHRRVLSAVEELMTLTAMSKNAHTCPIVQVPCCYRYLRADDPWWNVNIRRFPEGYSPSNTIESERIQPLCLSARERIIDKYCPKGLAEEIKNSHANRDCLVRPYLGRRRLVRTSNRPQGSRFSAFSLRNYPMHVDQLEELGLPIDTYAEIMADALASMHWIAEFDANDIEFVLAPVRNHQDHRQDDCSIQSTILGNHTVWLLDFDCCRKMSMNKEGVEQAVTAFIRNDPFYPRPGLECSQNRNLWDLFAHRYLETSLGILEASDKRSGLPKLFIDSVEKVLEN